VIVFSHTITPRLRYILDFIGKETIGRPFQCINDIDAFRQHTGPKINYSKEGIAESEFRIKNTELLFEKETREQTIECFETNHYKAFFKTEGDFPFDIFAASFYLLSRYEEYLPHKKDAYGRYAHENSLAFKEGFLQLPLINVWIKDFKNCLQLKFPSLTTPSAADRVSPKALAVAQGLPQAQRFPIAIGTRFTFLPTYDIDEAYSYKYKQWWRTMGGLLRSTVNGQWSIVAERLKVLSGSRQDPFDSFKWMDQLHKQSGLRPIYFFLISGKTGKYDKNISPSKRSMKHLIREHSDRYSIGIHPSWQSGDDPEKLKLEILELGHMVGKQISSSRQHYIRFTLPKTYRQLIDHGIESDFSMGYGSMNGFRASVTTPFFWYDLEREEQTKLALYPFCFMEANSFYEQKYSVQKAFEELKYYFETVRSVNGTLITIWHNSFLGTARQFSGWREMYEKFISLVTS
jgi:hypothetical protein